MRTVVYITSAISSVVFAWGVALAVDHYQNLGEKHGLQSNGTSSTTASSTVH